jgi:hypothetical protein
MISHLNGSFLAIAARRADSLIFAYNKRSDGSNVKDAELGQLLSDQGRLTSISFADIHRTKKYDPAHRSECYSRE